MELYYQGARHSTRSPRNPATMLQSDLLGFATPVTKMGILVTGSRNKLLTWGPYRVYQLCLDFIHLFIRKTVMKAYCKVSTSACSAFFFARLTSVRCFLTA